MRNMATDRELEVWLSEKENAMVEDIAALVEKADKAAYAVKRKGKNGFAFYSDLL